MSFQSVVYNTFFKRTSTFVITMVVGAFIFERTIDKGADAIFASYNRGKRWEDIKHKYEKKE